MRRSTSCDGGGLSSPRRCCSRVTFSPGSTRYAGSARHAAGRRVCSATMDGTPVTLATRTAWSAWNTQTSSSPFIFAGATSARSSTARRATTSTRWRPGRTCTLSAAPSRRAGSSLSSESGSKPSRRTPGSTTSRPLPLTSRSTWVSTSSGTPSVTLRNTVTSRRSSSRASPPLSRLSHTRSPASPRSTKGTSLPSTTRRTAAVAAGMTTDSGSASHEKRPRTACSPCGSSTVGTPPCSTTTAGWPSTSTSRGQCF